jgi:hypothetical protein
LFFNDESQVVQLLYDKGQGSHSEPPIPSLANYNITTMPHMTAVAYMAYNAQPAKRVMLASLDDP